MILRINESEMIHSEMMNDSRAGLKKDMEVEFIGCCEHWDWKELC